MEVEEILKKASLKVTKVRKEVLEIFKSVNYALDNHAIESKLDQVDRITLYRTLKSFEESGLIHKLNDTFGNTKYAICDEVCMEHHNHQHDSHVHFQCLVCEKTYCIDNVEIPLIKIPKKYHVTGQQITMTGICSDCK